LAFSLNKAIAHCKFVALDIFSIFFEIDVH
jgi:hypothetical protein